MMFKCLFCFIVCLFLLQGAGHARQRERESVVVNMNAGKLRHSDSRTRTQVARLTKSGRTMVIYVDESDCPSCFISHLCEWEIFMRECEEYNIQLDLMFIFCPPKVNSKIFCDRLSASSISHLSYIDTGNVFRKSNPWLEKGVSTHVFLMDETRVPTFVAPPPYSRDFMEWLKVSDYADTAKRGQSKVTPAP